MKSNLNLPRADGKKELQSALLKWRVWTFLGEIEIKQRYNKTLLGPFWITGALAIFVGACSFIYGVLFKQDLAEYMPYVAAGYIAWAYISGYLTEACSVFILHENYINQLRLPILIYPLKVVWRLLLTLLHHAVVLFVVLFAFGGINPLGILLSLIGLLTLSVALFSIGSIFAFYSVTNRDIPIVTISIFQILFLITPIIWPASALGKRMEIAYFNPFYHMVEVVRSPILNGFSNEWLVHLSVTGFLGLLGTIILIRVISLKQYQLGYFL